MSYKVYISFSARDMELARDLARRLREAGAKVSLPGENLATGDIVNLSIKQSLREANEVVVLLTDNAANSSWVLYEVGAADSLDKRVTPIVVNEGVERLAPLSGRQFVKYADLPKYISILRKRAQAA